MEASENLLTVRQVAFILKVHPLTIRRYIRENRLKAIKAGGSVRIRETDLFGFQADFTPNEKMRVNARRRAETKEFTLDDPIWRLNGRVANIEI